MTVMVERETDVLVIGAGQAGLAAAFHLRRRGFEPGRGFTVLDADASPGGAWAHRPRTLTMAAVHGFYELPGMPLPPYAGQRPAREVLPGYFAAYERANDLRVVRPARVSAVREAGDGRLLAESDAGRWTARPPSRWTGCWRHNVWPAPEDQLSSLQLMNAVNPLDVTSAGWLDGFQRRRPFLAPSHEGPRRAEPPLGAHVGPPVEGRGDHIPPRTVHENPCAERVG